MTQRIFSNQKKWKINSLIIAVACAIFPLSTSFAASDFVPGNAMGAKAILFTFSGLSNLGATAFKGGVGGKYFLSEKLALRCNLLFTTSSEKDPYNGTTPGTDGSKSGTSFGVGAAGEYFLSKARINPFVGGGIGFSTTSTSSKAKGANTDQQSSTENVAGPVNGIQYDPGLGLDIFALGGIEFFIMQEISLALEYQLGYFLLSRADSKDTRANVTTTTKNGSASTFGFRYGGFLTLAFYF